LLLIRLLPTLIVLLVGDYVVSNRCVFGSDTFGFRAAGGYVYVVCTAAMRTVAMRTDGVAFTFTSYRDSECCFHFHRFGCLQTILEGSKAFQKETLPEGVRPFQKGLTLPEGIRPFQKGTLPKGVRPFQKGLALPEGCGPCWKGSLPEGCRSFQKGADPSRRVRTLPE
jgi:hypothetical protein